MGKLNPSLTHLISFSLPQEQYRAIHFIVEEYINLFSTTANFKQHT